MLINSGSYLIALLLTIVIEVIIAIFFGYRKKSEIAAIIFINLITNPLINYLLIINGYLKIITISTATILFLEMIVVLLEWLLLIFTLRQNSKKLFILSLVMNLCSYIAGVLIFR